jgi:chitinase
VASCIDLFIKGNLPMIGGEVQGGPGSGFGVFDGIDLDWEWPSSEGNTGNVVRAEDKANFLGLCRSSAPSSTRTAPSVGRTYELTAFLPADPARSDAGIDPAVFNSLSFATVQGYDFYGPGRPQTNHQSQLRNPAANPAPANHGSQWTVPVSQYRSMGAPANKLVVGVPAYGRGWTGVPNVNNGLYQNGSPPPVRSRPAPEDYDVIKTRRGRCSGTPPTAPVWKYDGLHLLVVRRSAAHRDQGRYVKSNGLGGLMIWSLDGDDGTLVTAMQTGLA